MKLARIGEPGAERPAVLHEDGRWRDLGAVVSDIDAALLSAGSAGLARVREALTADLPEVSPGRFGPPVARVGKIVCVGLNYRDHAAETGAQAPTEPILFLKAGDTVIGPDDTVLVPRRSSKTDWEVELAVVIGATARYLESPDDAAAHIAGYATSNDVSEREFQIERGGQWDKGKNCEAFYPFGPWLVTADEVPDPQALAMRLSVNGETKQDGTSADMIFGVHLLVHYVSQFMVLYPGDVISTGTPAGVGMGSGTYLTAGDVIEVEIEGLGQQRQEVAQA